MEELKKLLSFFVLSLGILARDYTNIVTQKNNFRKKSIFFVNFYNL